MDTIIKEKLLTKKDKYIQMVIERVKRDFKEDIAIIGLTGSYSTNDFHEKSDIDLILINDTDKAWEISTCFILDDIGYDLYCSPWETRIENAAKLETPYISHLVDLEILYSANDEALRRFNTLRDHALRELAKPASLESLKRGKTYLSKAKEAYTDTLFVDDESQIRYYASNLALELINGLVALNNTYMKKGIKRYLDKIDSLPYQPDHFKRDYLNLIDAKDGHAIIQAAFKLLQLVNDYFEKLEKEWTTPVIATAESMKGTYEELWCNYKNKLDKSVSEGDKSYVYLTVNGAQTFLNEMMGECGAKEYDLMKDFDSENLSLVNHAFKKILNMYEEHYLSLGGKVKKYASFEELYRDFMKEA